MVNSGVKELDNGKKDVLHEIFLLEEIHGCKVHKRCPFYGDRINFTGREKLRCTPYWDERYSHEILKILRTPKLLVKGEMLSFLER